mmetsp:Transcript_10429/g.14744  ORF Transcript_10429/g.14744 Transcript_10429/m.14744 type:complete len:519 (+) Transcript_10429:475-2031(+)
MSSTNNTTAFETSKGVYNVFQEHKSVIVATTLIVANLIYIQFKFKPSSSGTVETKSKYPTSSRNENKESSSSTTKATDLSNHIKNNRGTGTWMEIIIHLMIVIFSHAICYYYWWSAEFNHGCIGNPFPLKQEVIDKATPNMISIIMYVSLIGSQLLLSAIMPGPTVQGFQIPQEHNRRLNYKCNALSGWYLYLAVVFVAHYSGFFRLNTLFENSGAMLTTAVVTADLISVIMYLECIRTGRSDGTIRNMMHDFVMGRYLNPRLWGGIVDLKIWAEIRVSWLLLFSMDVSCALCLQEELGYVPNRMWIILLIHGLYTNACMKGEECIPYTWDIFQECWGFMLIYWNLAGVAFAYTYQGRFIYATSKDLSDLSHGTFALLVMGVLAAYYVFDEANAQKNRFRAKQLRGAFVERRWAFPQLPNATLHDPKYLKTSNGSTLLIDGWWKFVRKPHYAADICLAVLLCLPCGIHHFLPYSFVCFFIPMLIHREWRDSRRCAKKYGTDWDEYCKMVPYVFIPGIY